MQTEQLKHYGKYAATAVVGVGVGLGGYAFYDTPTDETNQYQNLQEQLDEAQSENADFEEQVADLQTTVTDAEEREAHLEAQVEQFNQTVEDLRAENADLEDAVAEAQERTGLVDYLPVFEDEDVEFNGDITTEVDKDVTDGEGDYDQLDVDYSSDDGVYDVTITQYEESEDAEDAVEDFEDEQEDVVFTENGDERTVEVTGYNGELSQTVFEYDDDDAVEDVEEEDIEVTVDGDDVTNRITSVDSSDGDKLVINFEDGYYVNEGETVSVTYSDAGDGDLGEHNGDVTIKNSDNDESEFEYDADDDDTREDIYRDGNTVVELVGEETGDEDTFEAQYEDLQSHYE